MVYSSVSWNFSASREKKELARFSEAQPEVDAVRGEALRCAVDVHALKVAVALDDTLTRGVVGVAAGLTVVRECHEAVLLVPCHAPLRVQAVVLHKGGVAVGVVGVTFVPYLRGRGGMVGIAVLVGQRVAARNRARVGALLLGERFAYQSEAHVLDVTYSFEFDCAAHKNRLLILGFDISTIGLSTLSV